MVLSRRGLDNSGFSDNCTQYSKIVLLPVVLLLLFEFRMTSAWSSLPTSPHFSGLPFRGVPFFQDGTAELRVDVVNFNTVVAGVYCSASTES